MGEGGQAGSHRVFTIMNNNYEYYTNYINSHEWKILRKIILERDNYWCQCCGMAPATDVHHITYERLGNEETQDLTSLCNKCHNVLHLKDN